MYIHSTQVLFIFFTQAPGMGEGGNSRQTTAGAFRQTRGGGCQVGQAGKKTLAAHYETFFFCQENQSFAGDVLLNSSWTF